MLISQTYHFEFYHPAEKLRSVVADTTLWGVAAHQVIELFLQSVRLGLLESRWDILCPRCRVSKSTVTNLSEPADDPAVESIQRDNHVRKRTVTMKGIDTPVSIRQFSPSSPE